jgi:hypothetical protein
LKGDHKNIGEVLEMKEWGELDHDNVGEWL